MFTRKAIHNNAGDDRVQDLDVEDPKMDQGGALFLWISLGADKWLPGIMEPVF
jgi:hypothetical protein